VEFIWSQLGPALTHRYGKPIPDNYVTFDVETSGFSKVYDFVLEWGHCVVKDRQPVTRYTRLLNWYAVPGFDAATLDYRLSEIASDMSAKGKSWRITPELLREKGVDPRQELFRINSFLKKTHQTGLLLAGHNATSFDVPIVVNNLLKVIRPIADVFQFSPDSLLDTGIIVKGAQVPGHPDLHWREDDTLLSYQQRIAAAKWKGIKWALDGYCTETFGLTDDTTDPALQHTAGQDAYMTHKLIEIFRSMLPDKKAA
jgi:DNA polymerase III epsilon subunit-like protein